MTNPYQSPPVHIDTRSFWTRLRQGFNRAMRAYRDGALRDGIVGFRAFQTWFALGCLLVILQALVVAISLVTVIPFVRSF